MNGDNLEDLYPLTPLQQGMLFHELQSPDSRFYLNQLTCLLEGPLDAEALRRAFEAVVSRHPALRTAFVWEDVDAPLQVVCREVELPLTLLDWTGCPADAYAGRLEAFLEEDRHRGFALDEAPLLRLTLMRLAPERHGFVLTNHHLLFDGWSLPIILREAFAAYQAARAGRALGAPSPPPFRDYVAHLEARDLAVAERFWRRTLAGFDAATPLGIDRKPGGPDTGLRLERDLVLPPALGARLHAFTREHRLTLGTLIQGAWALLLARCSGQDDVVFGATVSGRPPELPGVEAMVGMFINTIPVRARLDGATPALEWLRGLQAQQSEAREHDHAPLAKVQRWSELPAGAELFESLVVLENYPLDPSLATGVAGLSAREVRTHERTHFPLILVAAARDEVLLRLTYDPRRFDVAVVDRCLGWLQRLLEQLTTTPGLPLDALELLGPDERDELLRTLARPREEAPSGLPPVHAQLRAHAARAPDVDAVVSPGLRLSYGELTRRTGAVAAWLRRQGVGPDQVVAVCLERSALLPMAILGALEAGGAYVPLDPSNPDVRLRWLLEDSGARALLTSRAVASRLAREGLPVLCVEDVGALEAEPVLAGDAGPQHLAYVIYTSGSTGTPKRVGVTHDALARSTAAHHARYGAGTGPVAVGFSFAFDGSLAGVFGALCAGETLVVPDEATFGDLPALAGFLARERVRFWMCVPSLYAALLEHAPAGSLGSLAHVMLGGEAILSSLVARHRSTLPHARLWNEYGPAEAVIGVTVADVTDCTEDPVPVGPPLAHARLYVLDSRLRLVPRGVAGEVFLGGEALARGYLERPDLTAERFLPDPFSDAPGARLYRTGDLGRWLPDGSLEFLGRRDGQVKLRGHRIELGEVEATLASCPGVRDAAARVREDVPGQRRLVAYVVPDGVAQEDGAPRLLDALQAHVRDRLPSYMVPSAYEVLAALPRLPNGKVDRAALPAPGGHGASRAESVPPRTGLERTLVGLFEQVLGREGLGIHDGFFELGGDSILSLQVVARARSAGLSLSPRQLFETPTVAELAAALEAGGAEAQAPVAAPVETPPFSLSGLDDAALARLLAGPERVEDAYPLSPMQEGMLFHGLTLPGTGLYVSQLGCIIEGPLDVPAFRRAWAETMERHPVLRTAFRWEDVPRPLQVVVAAPEVPLEQHDWSGLSSAEQAARLDAFLEEDRRRGFVLERAPLFRLTLLRLAPGRHRFLLSNHHAILDGWSLPLLLREVFARYEGQEPGPSGPPFREYIASLARREPAASEGFWRRTLSGVEVPTALGIDGTGARGRAAEVPSESRRLSPQQVARLQAVGRELGVTLNTLVQAAWSVVLSHYSGQEEVVFGVTVSGRPPELPGVESMVGLFINTLPLRVAVPRTTRVREWLRDVQARQVELSAHDQTPLASIQRWCGLSGGASLFESVVVFENYPLDAALSQGVSRLRFSDVDGAHRTHYPLVLVAMPGEGLTLTFSYDEARVHPALVQGALGHLERVLSGIAAGLEGRVGDLALLSPEETGALVASGRRAWVRPEAEVRVHARFEAQADARPDAVAVRAGERSLTYGELERRANQLAHRLRREGVGPDVPVALCVERSLELVVGVLGILKAGGAYVPLDLSYPPERVAYMLEDAGARVVVTGGVERLPDLGARTVVALDDGALGAEPSHRPEAPVQGSNVAYVIYTSGSTGRPKGTQVTHANVTRLFDATRPWFDFGPGDVWTLFHSYAFDFSVWELWGALFHGGRLVVVPHWVSRAPESFLSLLADEQVTVLNQTPSAFRQLIAAEEAQAAPRPLALRYVIFGGEALELRTLQPWVARHGATRPQLVNMYGITETTVHVTYRPLSREDIEGARGSVIGEPIPDLQLHVLDAGLRPVPVGVPGELYVGGEGLARGYLARPDLTAQRFLPDPFASTPGARLYRTGDRARRLPDGDVEYLGRLDEQVKIRGFRIELGEIEARLLEHGEVREAVVLARADGGERRLVAYVVPPRGARPETASLRAHLLQTLPEYMVPAAFVLLDALPLTGNGKVDRRALPAPASERAGLGVVFVPPRSPVEETLARIFADVLRLERVGVHDSFFALGGDSILCLQIVARARSAGLELSPREVFERPTVAELAGVARRVAPPGAERVLAPFELARLEDAQLRRLRETLALEDAYPLSPTQEGMLFHALASPGAGLYVSQLGCRIEGPLDLDAFRRAWAGAMERHGVLRTAFRWEDVEPPLQVVVSGLEVPLEQHDWSALPAAEQEARLARFLEEDRLRGFRLEHPPLFRISLLALGPGRHQLVLSYHHAVLDGWSLPVLMREVFARYEGHAPADAGRPYRDLIAHLEGKDPGADEAYWRGALAGVEAPTPLGIDGTGSPEHRPEVPTESRRLSAGLTSRLVASAREAGLTLNTLVQGAWAVVLSRYSARQDVVFGVTVSGRPPELDGVESMVGLFINTLPLRVTLPPGARVRRWLQELQARQAELSAHEHTPLAQVQRWAGLPGGVPIFESLVVFENYPLDAALAQGVGALRLSGVGTTNRTNYPLVLVAIPGDELSLTFSFDDARIHRALVRDALEHLEAVLTQLASPADAALGALELLGAPGQQRMRALGSGTGPSEPPPLFLARLERAIARWPDVVAVACEGDRVTYAELDRRTRRLAARLLRLGTGPDAVVGLCARRSVDLVVGLVAILRAGAAYLPLDPDAPAERLRGMLEDARACALVGHAALVEGLGDRPVVRLDTEAAVLDAEPEVPLPAPRPEALAYVIFTSGSTGRPKGVAVEHRQLASYLAGVIPALELPALAGYATVSTFAADLGHTMVFPALAQGGTLHVIPEERLFDGAALAEHFRANGIDCLKATPSHVAAMRDEDSGALALPAKRLVLGGEASHWSLVDALRGAAPGCALFNHYGPTETTVGVLTHRVGGRGPGRTVPLGRPLAGTAAYVLDDALRPVPIGVPGELYVGGAQVSRGYLGRPAETAERFLPDPFSSTPGARMYRTGDRVRWLPGGVVEFLGRADGQVKLRGFRIELGEVEAALREASGARQAVALVREDRAGDARLVAYLALEGAALDVASVRAALERRLPPYMVPSALVPLEALPLTPNGKVDVRALPAPEAKAAPLAGGEAPRAGTEQALAALWEDVLGVRSVSRGDDFFALGGHSLLVTRLVSRIRRTFGVELALREAFETPGLAAQAARIDALAGQARGAGDGLVPADRSRPLPASFPQRRLWFLDQLDPGGTAYNVPMAVRVRGPLDVDAFQRALDELVRRHEVLRTAFSAPDGEPVQVIAPSARVPLRRLSGVTLEEAAASEAGHAFDLAHGPLLRAAVLALGPLEHALFLTLHHVVTDGWSNGVLLAELEALYRAFAAGEPSPLPELGLQYADHAAWQRSPAQEQALERQLAYWRERLAGAQTVLELPADRARPAVQTYRAERMSLELSAGLSQAVRAVAQAQGATPFMALLAGFAALAHRLTGQEDLLIGTPSANRNRLELEGLIGFFVNTLVIRAELSGEPSFAELVRRVRESCLGAYSNAELPFERLVEALQPVRDLARTPLIQVMVNQLNPARARAPLPGLEWSPVAQEVPGSKFDLTLYVTDRDEGTQLDAVFNADLFDRERITELLGQLRHLLEQAVSAPDRALSEHSLVTPQAATKLPNPTTPPPPLPLGEGKGEGVVHPSSPLGANRLLARLEAHAKATPEAPALTDHRGAFTYRDLTSTSRALARHLRGLGVRPGDRVALYAHRDATLAAALIAIWRAGAAFVVLDPADTPPRLAARVRAARPTLILAQEAAGPLPEPLLAAAPALELRAPANALASWSAGPEVDLPPTPAPDALAYLAFTSGSTGEPKGILATFEPLEHFLAWHEETHGLAAADRFSVLSGLAHDPLLRDVFAPLWVGGTACFPDDETVLGGRLSEWLARHHVSALHLTPSAAKLLGTRVESVRLACFGGERLTPADVARFRALCPNARCVSFYGATETPQAMGHQPVEPGEARPLVPLGRGIDGVQLLVVTPRGTLAGVGEPGEVWIRTRYLAQGYLEGQEGGVGVHNPLTLSLSQGERGQARFIGNPFTGVPGDRVYRTGDVGRFLPDGRVEYVGRGDAQVKVRGHRIELGEIEARLLEHPSVTAAAALLREDRPGHPRLVAYAVTRDPACTAAALRAHLSERLPESMRPAAYVLLDALPLTPNRKVDRGALPAPAELDAPADARSGTWLEELMAGLFAEVLGLDHVPVDARFFELGGHSLAGTQLLARARAALGVELPLRALFEEPTPAGLARRAERLLLVGAGHTVRPLVRREGVGDAPLSFAQERLWFLERLAPGQASYNMATAVELRGPVDAQALARALQALTSRHASLRTTFHEVDGRPVQRVSEHVEVELERVDLGQLPEAERPAESLRRLSAAAARPYDLSRGPLVRALLVTLAPDWHRLLVGMHHLVSDGWSMGVVIRELTALYADAPLPELPVQYTDFARWQREELTAEVMARDLAWWRAHLAEAPAELSLPTDRPRPRTPSSAGAKLRFELPPGLVRRVEALARAEGCTPFMAFLAGFQALLHRYSGEEHVAVGTPIAGRTQAEVEGLVGMFANTLALCGDLSGRPTFRALLARTREAALGAYAHQGLPFERLVQELQPSRDLGRSPIFQVMFVLQSAPRGPSGLAGLSLAPLALERGTSRFDLTLELTPAADGMSGAVEYSTALFDAATIHRLVHHYVALLEAAVTTPETSVSSLPLLDEAERRRALLGATGTARPEEPPHLLHALVEAQVDRTPDAIAVSFEGRTLTFRELDVRANQLAHRLRALGVGADSIVGVLAERSLELVVSLLGILKAGAAYLPLDPTQPRARLALLLEDTQPSALVAQPQLADVLAQPAVLLDAQWEALTGEPTERPGEVAHPDGLAYVLYTSGSTGRPKGVMSTHRGIANLMRWTQEACALGAGDRVLQKTPFVFDASVWELFWPLVHGAQLVMARPEGHKDPAYLARVCAEERITALQLVPSMLAAFLDEDLSRCTSLRWLMCGGERLTLEHQARAAAVLPGAELVNLYGPTEAAVQVTAWHCRRGDSRARLPIGRPIPNARVYVLDEALEPVPVGVAGELYLGGVPLARGYLGRPDLTAERFLPDPHASEPGARLYRTGDRGRYLEDGTLEYLGRVDHQVKVRGNRVELGAVEAALTEHSAVREAVVLVRDERLVAYLVPRPGAALEAADVRAYLQQRRPEYEVPSAYVVLDALPRLPSGKVDLRALATPSEREGRAALVAPRDALEAGLVALFEELLGVTPIGVDDSFFELGGHSLLAVRLVAAVRKQLGREVALAQLFRAPTVAGLAASLREEPGGARGPLVPLRREGSLPPLFLVHPFGGQVFWYEELARRLGTDRPCYGLEAPAVEDARDIEATAARLVEAVRAHQPEGPYFLAGWSMGGLIAFEMAQQLRRAGAEVGLVALIDTADPAFRNEWAGDDAAMIAQAFEGILGVPAVSADALRAQPPEERLTHAHRLARAAGLLAEDMDLSAPIALVRAQSEALERYRPLPYPGPVVFLRARDAVRSLDPVPAWRALAATLEVHDLPGTHRELLLEPHVDGVAEVLSRYLCGETASLRVS